MPPKVAASKEKPLKGPEAEEMVLQYLQSVNRPYASTDVSANLKGKVTKPEAQRALTALADKGRLTVKTYGKQTIFVYSQAQQKLLDSNELEKIESSIKSAQESLDEHRKELKCLTLQQQTLESSLPTFELEVEISRLTASNKAARESLRLLGQSNAAPISRDDTGKIDQSWVKWRKEWTARHAVYKQLVGMLEDGGMNRAQLEEDKGIEQDDDDARKLEASDLCKPAAGKTSRQSRAGPPSSAGTTVLGKRSRDQAPRS